MKINFACGKQTWDGWYCIDAAQHPKATREVDLLHAFRFDGETLANKLHIDDGVASEVHSYHFIEHVYQWEAPAVINEFKRLLRPGGRLVLELPNIELACKHLLKGSTDQYSMWPLYGDPGTRDVYMCHRWGYTRDTISKLLKFCGMREIVTMNPKTHGARKNRDMRVECRK
jgi:predicted SAM-dependent methyltransferase